MTKYEETKGFACHLLRKSTEHSIYSKLFQSDFVKNAFVRFVFIFRWYWIVLHRLLLVIQRVWNVFMQCDEKVIKKNNFYYLHTKTGRKRKKSSWIKIIEILVGILSMVFQENLSFFAIR